MDISSNKPKAAFVIAVIKQRDTTVGYRVTMGFPNETVDLTPQQIKDTWDDIEKSDGAWMNIELDNGEIKGSNGSLDRYPQIVGGRLVGKSSITILAKIEDLGFVVCDLNGNIKKLRTADVVKYGEANGISNGKIIHNADGSATVSSIKGNYIETTMQECRDVHNMLVGAVSSARESERKFRGESMAGGSSGNKHSQTANQQEPSNAPLTRVLGPTDDIFEDTNGNKKIVFSNVANFPTIDIVRRDVDAKSRLCSDGKGGTMTLDQKLARAVISLKKIRPFYYCILSQLRKVYVDGDKLGINTMAVSEKSLYINTDFLAEISDAKVLFVLMHEVGHIGWLHAGRKGEHRNAEVWNWAGDLYINRALGIEFGLEYGERKGVEGNKSIEVELPDDCLWSDKIDLKTDTLEKIYDELIKDIKKKSQQGQGQSQGSGQGNGKGSGQGQGQGQGNGQGQGSGQGNGQGQNQGQGGGQGQGNGQGQEQQGQGTKRVEVTFRGTKIGEADVTPNGKIRGTQNSGDIVYDKGDKQDKGERGKEVIEKARVMAKQAGYSLDKGSPMERFVEEALAPVIPWQRLVLTRLLECSKEMRTYAKPDKRHLGRGMILPGNKPATPDKLKGVKIGIDTSGSITDIEIGQALKQIKGFMNRYKASGEIMYWDTDIQAKSEFRDIKEAMKLKPQGCGGTDPRCVFEYCISKECKQKPSIIIMFSDGYFDWDSLLKYKAKLKGCSIIWIINDNHNYYNLLAVYEDDRTKILGRIAKFDIDKLE